MKTFKEIEELKKIKSNRVEIQAVTDLREKELTEIKLTEKEKPSKEDISKQYSLEIETFDLIEMILKDQSKLHNFLQIPSLQSSLLPRFLTISLIGFVLYGLVISLVLTVTGYWPTLASIETWLENPAAMLLEFNPIESSWGNFGPWINGNVLLLIFAFAFGLIATSCVCLPSLYFYSLLAGVRMSMVEVVAHAVKCKAVSSVALIGILPIYVAMAMGAVIFSNNEALISMTLFLGLFLPFIAGMWGTVSMYRAFSILAENMQEENQCKRTFFLDRLVISWSVCYTAVMPVMVHTIWQKLSQFI